MMRYSCLLLLLLCTKGLSANAPDAISYAFAVHDSAGKPLTGKSFLLRVSLYQDSVNGPLLYREMQRAPASDIGLVSLKIGAGEVVSGVFAQLFWKIHTYYLKIELDTATGGKFPIRIGPHLLTVPYTFQAASYSNGAHYVGEPFGGGIVFYVYAHGMHGLIAAPMDIDGGTGAPWLNVQIIETNASSTWNGVDNTEIITAALGQGNYAAKLCENYKEGGFDDWYLPAAWELNLLYDAAYLINKAYEGDSEKRTMGLKSNDYWSSSETDAGFAVFQDFYLGTQNAAQKGNKYRVRAIRAF